MHSATQHILHCADYATYKFMRSKLRFYTATGNREYSAKTVKEPYIDRYQKRKHPATFRETTAAFGRQKYLHIRSPQRTAAWTA